MEVDETELELFERNVSCRHVGMKQPHNFTIPHSTQIHKFAPFTDERQFPKLQNRLTVWCHFRRRAAGFSAEPLTTFQTLMSSVHGVLETKLD